MSVTPSSGRRGVFPLDTTSPRRDEAIQRVWTFLAGAVVKNLRIFGEGAVAGELLVAKDADGNITFSDILPADVVTVEGETNNLNGVVVATAEGEYSVSIYAECTTAGAGTLYVSLTYTDDVGAVTVYPIVGLSMAATGRDQAVVCVRAPSGELEYGTEIIGASGSPEYNLYISAVRTR